MLVRTHEMNRGTSPLEWLLMQCAHIKGSIPYKFFLIGFDRDTCALLK